MKTNFYRHTANGIEIMLASTNEFTLIDADDLSKVIGHRWYGRKPTAKSKWSYAFCKNGGRNVYLHRLITDAPKGKVVDHTNRNTLDNRRCNLRVCTMVENSVNTGGIARSSSKTGILGVSTHYSNDRKPYYVARVNRGKKSLVAYFPHTQDGLNAASQRVKEFRAQLHDI